MSIIFVSCLLFAVIWDFNFNQYVNLINAVNFLKESDYVLAVMLNMHSCNISNLYKWPYDCAIHSELYSIITFLFALLFNIQMSNSMEISIVLRIS